VAPLTHIVDEEELWPGDSLGMDNIALSVPVRDRPKVRNVWFFSVIIFSPLTIGQ
jgi:hypothetical protein